MNDVESPARRYAPFVTAFTVLASVLAHEAARRDREPDGGALQFTESALATFFIARMIAHEKTGAVVRAPFVEPVPGTDPADGHGATKRPAGSGLRHGIGELVTCTRCLGPWAAAAITFGHAFAPGHARVATRVMALSGANVLVQAAQEAVSSTANRMAAGGGD